MGFETSRSKKSCDSENAREMSEIGPITATKFEVCFSYEESDRCHE